MLRKRMIHWLRFPLVYFPVVILIVLVACNSESSTDVNDTISLASPTHQVEQSDSTPNLHLTAEMIAAQTVSAIIAETVAAETQEARLQTAVVGTLTALAPITEETPTITITLTPPASTPTTTPSLPAQPQVEITTPVNVRSGPGTCHIAIGVLTRGTIVLVKARNNNSSWYQIELANDRAGWISAAYAQPDNSTLMPTVPVASPIPPCPAPTPSLTPTTTPVLPTAVPPIPVPLTQTPLPISTPTSTSVPYPGPGPTWTATPIPTNTPGLPYP